jgi:hypothetical protein
LATQGQIDHRLVVALDFFSQIVHAGLSFEWDGSRQRSTRSRLPSAIKAHYFNACMAENKGAGWRATEVFFQRAGYWERDQTIWLEPQVRASSSLAPISTTQVFGQKN